jgi:CRISPR type IV-associated protein Csf3
MKHTPFGVTMALKTPVILTAGSWLTLDALLGAQIYAQTQCVERAHSEIPLAHSTWGLAEDGMAARVWHGSAMFLSQINHPGKASFKRSMDMRDLFSAPAVVMGSGRNASKPAKNQQIDQLREPYAAMVSHYPTLTTDDVRWFGCGDIDVVRDLLEGVRFVGKKHHQGYGEVATCVVDEIGEDWSIARTYRDKLRVMRPIPVDAWAALQQGHPSDPMVAMAASEPPYFDATKRRCMVPHTRLAFWG